MKRTRKDVEPIKKYGDFKFIDNLAADLRDELIKFFGKDNGLKTFVYSLLGILYKNRYDWYKDNYNHSFISKEYPNIPISKNSVASFIKQLGVYDSLNKEFLTIRLVDHEILIFDGTTFANDESCEFSEYGIKYKQTRRKQINKIKVFDIVRLEAVYSEVILGNVIDKRAFISVLNKFNLKNTIIIIDRGFNSEENVQYLLENNIKFIMPLNDNSVKLKKISNENEFDSVIKFQDKYIQCVKVQDDNQFFYCYKDSSIAFKQENNYLKNIYNEKDGYTFEKNKKNNTYNGIIAIRANCDFEIDKPFFLYKQRWLIETNFKLQKNSLDESAIRKHDLATILGDDFILQIQMMIYTRMYKVIQEYEELKGKSI